MKVILSLEREDDRSRGPPVGVYLVSYFLTGNRRKNYWQGNFVLLLEVTDLVLIEDKNSIARVISQFDCLLLVFITALSYCP